MSAVSRAHKVLVILSGARRSQTKDPDAVKRPANTCSFPREDSPKRLLRRSSIWSLLALQPDVAGSPFSNLTAGTHLSLLGWLANPDLDLLLLLAGLLLIYVECNLPGKVVPGALGLVAILLAIFGLGRLPLHASAFSLLAAGLLLLALELRVRKGLFATVGTLALIAGLRTLVVTPRVHLATAIVTGTVFSLVTLLLARIALRARANKSLGQSRPNPSRRVN